MAEEKVIKLEEIIELVDDFLRGEKTQEDLNAYGANMKINMYLPLLDKMKIVIALTTRYVYSGTELHEVRVAELYKDLFFYGLLPCYGLIDCSNKNLHTFENYDKLFPIFSPFLLSFCESDYNILKEFLRDALDQYATRDFVEAINEISTESLEKAVRENKQLIKDLEKNKELIGDLREIAAMNNPLAKNIVDQIKGIADRDSEFI